MVLLYDAPFWDETRDMFGLLNEPEEFDSLETVEYAKNRGRFYLIWNASKTSGRPMLVALMAGQAAHDVETTDMSTLLDEVNGRLRSVFPDKDVPTPIEVIVTRWKRDPFTRGTYSYVGAATRPGDYDLMAQPVGNLHFAGEATCGTHPATVHGAFLSGLRVAAEVMESMVGPIVLPNPLVKLAPVKQEAQTSIVTTPHDEQSVVPQAFTSGGSDTIAVHSRMIKQEHDLTDGIPAPLAQPTIFHKKVSGHPRHSVCAADPSFWAHAQMGASTADYEAGIMGTVLSMIGERPIKPNRPGVNPFLLYTKNKWEECKTFCAKDPTGAGRDMIRQTLGKWWRALSNDEKAPYLQQSQTAQDQADQVRRDWEQKTIEWDVEARRIREEYRHENPPPSGSADISGVQAIGVSKRKTNVSNCVVLDHS